MYLIRADHPLIFQSIMCKLFQVRVSMPALITDGRISMFCRYFEDIKDNGLITSSPCESINSDIRKKKAEPLIKVFHFLEIIGYNRCIDLLNITSEMTPYYMVKAFQYLNEPYEKCVHKFYFSATIKESLKDINSPVSLDIVELFYKITKKLIYYDLNLLALVNFNHSYETNDATKTS